MKIDIDKYNEEDISNISKEETPIVKALEKRQNVSFVVAFVLVCSIFADAMYAEEIGHIPATIIAIILTVSAITLMVYSVIVAVKKDKIKKWQVSELYKLAREKGKQDQ